MAARWVSECYLYDLFLQPAQFCRQRRRHHRQENYNLKEGEERLRHNIMG